MNGMDRMDWRYLIDRMNKKECSEKQMVFMGWIWMVWMGLVG